MSPVYLSLHEFEFNHPAKEEPSWKTQVDRWYQLDAYAYGLAEAYSRIRPITPAMIVLASPGASNETDFQFASNGATSPAKFVHTLPNIRCSPLCQVMGWNGPVLCLQKDPYTVINALREAYYLFKEKPIWVVSVFPHKGQGYRAQFWVLTQEASKNGFKFDKNPQKNLKTASFQTDQELQRWLSLPVGPFALAGDLKLAKPEE